MVYVHDIILIMWDEFCSGGYNRLPINNDT